MIKGKKVATLNADRSTNKGSFDFTINCESAVVEYDNRGAFDTLQAIKERREKIDVSFYLGKDMIPCAWIESKHVDGFKLQLSEGLYRGIFDYLFNGENTDKNADPTDVKPLDAETDYPFKVLKELIVKGKAIKYVPRFRERKNYITATLPCLMGKVVFRIKRTEDVEEYLLEHEQPI